MTLTAQQYAQLKGHIDSVPSLAAFPLSPDGFFDLAVALNQIASPVFYVWKTEVVITELMQNGFDWARVDNLTVGKARIWDYMTKTNVLNPSKPNVRAGFEACWSVEAADQPVRQAIYNGSQRPATIVEKLFAVGAGTTATHHGAGPATMVVEGQISPNDVEVARLS